MRSLSREWKAAMSARGVESRRLVSMFTAAGERTFVTGNTPLFSAQPSIVSVSSHSAAVDPWTCAVSIGERIVKMKRDVLVRELVTGEYLDGKRLEVYLGCTGLAFNHWTLEWVGQIVDVTSGADNSVTIRAQDVSSFLRERQIEGVWIDMHPLDVLVDIFGRCEVPVDLWDESSFDYTEYEDISHFRVSRGGPDPKPAGNFGQNANVNAPATNAWSAVQDILQMVNGALTFAADGRLTFQRFNRDALPVRHWTQAQISGFSMESSNANRADSITVEFLRGGQSPDVSTAALFTRLDEDAPEEHIFAGQPARHRDRRLSSDWINGVAVAGYIEAEDTEVDLYYTAQNGFSGLHYSAPGGTQAEIDGTRNPTVDPGVPRYQRLTYARIEDEIVSLYPISYSVGGVMRVFLSRGFFGTTPEVHVDPVHLQDITIPWHMAEDRARFAHGLPLVQLRVPLSEFDVQLFDFVTFDEPRCLFRDCDGATSEHVWSVISQAVDESGSEPSILVKLCYVRKEVS